ncbi:proteoglycan 4-like [Ornithodoros turicata]|uniref:proteoglycan 4-like n=1 Tax=Ornithodoros turicata TaxID=34597 RepID=UPI00313A0444
MCFRLILVTLAALSASDAQNLRQVPRDDYSVFVRALPPGGQDSSHSSQQRFNAQFAIRPQPQFPSQQNTFIAPQQFTTYDQQSFRHFPQNQQHQLGQVQLHGQQVHLPAQQTFNNNGPQHLSFVDTQARQFPQEQATTTTTTTTQNPFVQFQQTHSVSVSTSNDPFRHSKVIGSLQPPTQAIQKAPASEIQSDKKAEPKDKAAGSKDKDKDEYVVYYYYYYDDDNKKNNNLSLNFDDVPNLEGFDKVGKSNKAAKTPNPQNRFEPKPATAVPPAGQQPAPPAEQAVTSTPQSVTQVPSSVSVESFTSKAPLSGPPNLDLTGAVLTEPAAGGVLFEQRITQNASSESQQNTNEITNKKAPEETTTVVQTTTQTPTTLPPTTTTEELTTTEKTRRPFGNRRRPGGHGHRLPTGRRTTSTTSTTTTRQPVGVPRRNRRPSLRPNRLQFGRRPPPGRQEEEPEEAVSEEEPTTTVASTTKKRFGAGRFGNKPARSRSSTTSSTTTAVPPRRGGPSASGLFGRTRNPRPRPAFLRNRGKKPVEEKPVEHDEPSATTQINKEEPTEPSKRLEEPVDAEEEPTEAPPVVTQETKPSRSRFGSRPPLFGGRPRPNVLGR